MKTLLAIGLCLFLLPAGFADSSPGMASELPGDQGIVLAGASVGGGNESSAGKATGTLTADTHALAETGGTINFYLDAGPQNGNRNYLLIGSASGTTPGIPIPGGYETLPLNWDWFTEIVLALYNTAIFKNFHGKLLGDGKGEAIFDFPGYPGTNGLELCFAYCLNNPFDVVSNPVEIKITKSGMVYIPSGEYEMGDHHDGIAAALPVHMVYVNGFCMDIYEVTTAQYVDGLNWSWSQGGIIEVNGGVVYKAGSSNSYPYCETTISSGYSHVAWDGSDFSVVEGGNDLPMVMVTWYGAAAYANWRSNEEGRTPCYDLSSWECNFGSGGYRLPTEAEWEKGARGGKYDPYFRYPWGDALIDIITNHWNSCDPYEAGSEPWTTPVGFYNGAVQLKANFNWPGGQTSYQTMDGKNKWGLYNMAGNAWEWCNDWFDATYYSSSPYENPKGPNTGSNKMHRGGAWSHIGNHLGCAFRANINPDFRNHDIGFRLVLD